MKPTVTAPPGQADANQAKKWASVETAPKSVHRCVCCVRAHCLRRTHTHRDALVADNTPEKLMLDLQLQVAALINDKKVLAVDKYNEQQVSTRITL